LEKSTFIVALTGGIASGKTLVSDEFAKLGVPVVDMDIIAHEIVEPGQPALIAIENAFGNDLIDSDGYLKRTKLRAIIFNSAESRRELESILHPIIRQRSRETINKITAPYCILVIPLLSDPSTYPDIDRVLVVDVSPETQFNRLMARDSTTREQAELALASQISRSQRLDIADDVLANSGSPEEATQAVSQLNRKYLQLASSR